MRIVLATPLYPPDIADPAPYTYELARRLSESHEVTVVTYGRYPEELPGVTVRTVDKRLPSYRRAWHFYQTLRSVLPHADMLYIQSGISAELPALFVPHTARLFWRKSAEPKRQSLLRKLVEYFTKRRATIIPESAALIKPELLPFEDTPASALSAWEQAWKQELTQLV